MKGKVELKKKLNSLIQLDKKFTKNKVKKYINVLNRDMLSTIKGKLLAIAIVALGGILFLGAIVLVILGFNNRTYKLTRNMNDIKVEQYDNEALYVQYSNSINTGLLYSIRANLEEMKAISQEARKIAKSKVKEQIIELHNTIDTVIVNLDQIIQLTDERGVYEGQGKFQEYVKEKDQIISELTGIVEDSYWLDGTLSHAKDCGNSSVQVDGTTYNYLKFNGKLPNKGTREQLMVRIGGQAIDFKREVYINNISFSKGDQVVTLDLNEWLKENAYWGSGSISGEIELVEFNNVPSIKMVTNMQAARGMWEGASAYIGISSIDLSQYDSIQYDCYYSGEPYDYLGVGYSLNGKYGFQYAFSETITSLYSYTQQVATGDINWNSDSSYVMQLQKAIDDKLAEIETNLSKYIMNPDELNRYLDMIKAKQKVYSEIKEYDEKLLTLKASNIALEDQLLVDIETINAQIEHQMHLARFLMIVVILVIIILVMGIVWNMTNLVSKSIQKGVDEFEAMLHEMANGNLAARTEVKSKDEFGKFAIVLNNFADKLAITLGSIQELVNEVGDRNSSIAISIRQIINGEEGSKKGILQLKQLFHEVTNETSTQSQNTEEVIAFIQGISANNEHLLQSIIVAKEDSIKTLDKVNVGQKSINTLMGEIGNINQSVAHVSSEVAELVENAENIGSILEAIKDLSSQTDLLSLNTSIEANKAGESGKGFGVVASEIKKLAEQTRDEADKINQIIDEINANINKVEEANKAVEENIQETLNITNNFELIMGEIIQFTGENVDNINAVYRVINEQNEDLQQIYQAVDKINEEAIQIAENTGDTMEISNVISDSLIENLNGIEKVMDVSEKLKDDMAYFKI